MKLRSVFDASEIKLEFESAGTNPNFVIPIWKYVIQNPDCVWDEIPSLPSAAYTILHSKFKTLTSSLHSVFHSSDGTTSKLLIKLQIQEWCFSGSCDNEVRYSVGDVWRETTSWRYKIYIMYFISGWLQDGLYILCYCTMGFKSNLTSGEILLLYHWIQKQFNIVFMGMGEPLNNYNAVFEAVRVMLKQPFQLSPKRITISTVGIVHAISKLHNDLPGVSLAVSLHAPVQEIHCQSMLELFLFKSLWMHFNRSKRTSSILNQQKIFIEYIMLAGVNDQEEHAHKLGELLKTFQVVINLKTFNQPSWVHKPIRKQQHTKRINCPENHEGNIQNPNHSSQRNGSGY